MGKQRGDCPSSLCLPIFSLHSKEKRDNEGKSDPDTFDWNNPSGCQQLLKFVWVGIASVQQTFHYYYSLGPVEDYFTEKILLLQCLQLETLLRENHFFSIKLLPLQELVRRYMLGLLNCS